MLIENVKDHINYVVRSEYLKAIDKAVSEIMSRLGILVGSGIAGEATPEEGEDPLEAQKTADGKVIGALIDAATLESRADWLLKFYVKRGEQEGVGFEEWVSGLARDAIERKMKKDAIRELKGCECPVCQLGRALGMMMDPPHSVPN